MGSAAFITGCNASSQINGVRLFLRDGMPLGLEGGLDKIGLIARRVKLGPRHARGQNKSLDVMKDYRSFLKRISPNIKPTRVALDASDGAAGEIWPFLCAGMPIEFIRTHCEPEERSPLLGKPFPGSAVTRVLRNSILESDVDFGVAVDFDGDICQFFDEKGNLLPGGIASALIARSIAEQKSGIRIVYDVRLTAALREEVKTAGGEAIPCAGDKISLAKSLVSKDAAYATDVYGRHFFRDMCCAESPALAMLYLCSAVSRSGKPLSQLANEIGRYTTTGVLQYNMPSRRDAIEAIERLERKFTKAQKHTLYGLKFQFSDWWFHVRNPAGSAAIQLVVEGRSESDCRRGRKTVEDIIKE
jgi:phosphomannomutase